MSTSIVINQEFRLLDTSELDKMELMDIILETNKSERYISELQPYNEILTHYHEYLQDYLTERLNNEND